MNQSVQAKSAAAKAAAIGLGQRARAGAASMARSAAALSAAIDPSTALLALRKVRDSFNEFTALAERLPAIEADLAVEVDRAFAELDADLRLECASRGWECHGQWPTLRVAMGLDVSVDESKRSATVGSQKVARADVTAIVQALQPQVETLIPTDFDGERFLVELGAVYDSIRGDDSMVSAFELYRAFVIRSQKAKFWRNATSAAFVAVSADQFRARLSRTMAQGATKLPDGRALRLLPSIDPSDALFVYLPAEDRFALVGRIGFAAE